MRAFFSIVMLATSALLLSCEEEIERTAWVENLLSWDRREVVAMPLYQLGDKKANDQWIVIDKTDTLTSQIIDSDGDSIDDQLLCYVSLEANEKKSLLLKTISASKMETDISTHSRFVQERIDDYAWENDLVAFRAYGPEAQRLVEEGETGGTLSSGIDCWLKRVNYPVIDKWYAKHVEGGTYHKDEGEGYDPYHVGASRGCGGTGYFSNDSIYAAKNFVSWRKIAEGPVRNIFELSYDDWSADGIRVHETKRISIDLGKQLCRVDNLIRYSDSLPYFTIGLTLHENKGKSFEDSTNGIFAYWEPIDDSALGTAVVVDPSSVLHHQLFKSNQKDKSHLLVNVQPNNTITHFTGFAWSKAGRIASESEWNQYLQRFTKELQSPIEVTMQP